MTNREETRRWALVWLNKKIRLNLKAVYCVCWRIWWPNSCYRQLYQLGVWISFHSITERVNDVLSRVVLCSVLYEMCACSNFYRVIAWQDTFVVLQTSSSVVVACAFVSCGLLALTRLLLRERLIHVKLIEKLVLHVYIEVETTIANSRTHSGQRRATTFSSFMHIVAIGNW